MSAALLKSRHPASSELYAAYLAHAVGYGGQQGIGALLFICCEAGLAREHVLKPHDAVVNIRKRQHPCYSLGRMTERGGFTVVLFVNAASQPHGEIHIVLFEIIEVLDEQIRIASHIGYASVHIADVRVDDVPFLRVFPVAAVVKVRRLLDICSSSSRRSGHAPGSPSVQVRAGGWDRAHGPVSGGALSRPGPQEPRHLP